MPSIGASEEIELIRASGLFDEKWYLEQYPDVKALGLNPIEHYCWLGARLNRNPSPSFSAAEYLKKNGLNSTSGVNPLIHALRLRKAEANVKRGDNGGTNGNIHPLPTLEARYPRFTEREYGPIALQIDYDNAQELHRRDLSICVHIHLFHVDLLDEFVKYLNSITLPFTLLVSVQEAESSDRVKRALQEGVPNATRCVVKNVQNIGRDVMPWIVEFKAEILEHDVFFHGHTKKSTYESNFSEWRRFLLHNSIGSKAVFSAIYNLFATDASLGLVYPPYFHSLKKQPAWGANRKNVNALMSQLKLPYKDDNAQCPDFPAGSFFWCRTSMLRPLLTANIKADNFAAEGAQIDGTLGHAIERALGIIPQSLSMKKMCAGVNVGYDLTNYWNDLRARKIQVKPKARAPKLSIKPESKSRIAVFTCITGNFDELMELPLIERGVDYFCFTDSERSVGATYQRRNCRYIDPNPRKTARFVKTHPHIFFADYDFAVWIDGNILPLGGFHKYVQKVVDENVDLGLIAHTVRRSYKEEADECARIGADKREVIEEQIKRYDKHVDEKQDLIETNLIVSRLGSDNVRSFFRTWWNEINSFSIRDQISVNYALQKSKASYTCVVPRGVTLRDHPDFALIAHDLKDRSRISAYIRDQYEHR